MSFEAPRRVATWSAGLTWAEVRFDRGELFRLDILTPHVARIRFAPSGKFSSRRTGAVLGDPAEAVRVEVTETASLLHLATDVFQIFIDRDPFRVAMLWPDREPFLVDVTPGLFYDSESGVSLMRKQALADEHILGMGARGGPVDRRGRGFAMVNTDSNAYGPETDPLYISTPFYYSIRGGRAAGVFLDSAAQPYFDFGRSTPGMTELSVKQGDLDYYVLAGPSPLAVAQAWTRLTGATPLPPKWALGYHQSRYSYYSEQELLEVAATLRRNQIPADVLWLDIDYMDRFHLFTWNPEKFPNPTQMNAKLEADGFRRININEPCVLTTDPVWEQLSKARFLVTGPDRQSLTNEIWFGDVGWMDFSHRPFRTWYKQRLSRFLNSGVSGLWNDLNEPAQNFMPEAVYDFDGERRTELEARNLYALKMVEITDETLRELRPDERPWQISRSGFAGIQRYSANWSGDANSDWQSLATNVQMTVSMGLSGQEFFGHDAGGFLGSPSPELFTRWLQFSLYTALFRNHAINEAERREPWLFPDPWRGIIHRTIERRYELLPLLYSLMDRASRGIHPFVAPLSFWFPNEEKTFDRSFEYMLGDSLLIAPVIQEGAETREVFLPGRGEEWIEIHTGKSYPAGIAQVPASPEYIPVFAREGAVIPRGPVIQHTGEQTSPDLELDIFPGRDTAFTLYEDDGHTMAFARGQYLRTQLALLHGVDGLRLQKRKEAGELADPARVWRIRIHRVLALPRAVTLNGSPFPVRESESAPGWQYDSAQKMVIAAIQDTGGEFVLRIRP